MYRSPQISLESCFFIFDNVLEILSTKFNYLFITGNINIDVFVPSPIRSRLMNIIRHKMSDLVDSPLGSEVLEVVL